MKTMHKFAPAVFAVLCAAIPADAAKGNYASVNGLNMYYEIHGTGRPLVLLHGALSATDSSFGKVLPSLAKTRQVAVEQHAHGHTADIDRPLSYEQMADDTAALLRQLEIERADIFGYSMGGGVALQIAIRHPDLVRKLVVAAATYNSDGIYPEILEGIENLKPENLAGSPWQKEYARTAPNPEHWPTLIAKAKELDRQVQAWPPEAIQSIKAPTLVIIGDSDVVRTEHAVQMFRLLGAAFPAMSPASRIHSSPCSRERHTSHLCNAPVCCFRSSRRSPKKRERK